MRRRSKAGPDRPKSHRGKPVIQNRRGEPKPTHQRNPSAADRNVAQLTRERDEALEREKATAEVLRVVSSSPGDLESVFQTLVENATRLCDANFGSLYLCEGDAFRLTAMHNAPPAYEQLRRSEPVVHPSHPAVYAILGRLAESKAIVHIADLKAQPPEAQGALVKLAGARTVAAVPILKDNEAIGGVII